MRSILLASFVSVALVTPVLAHDVSLDPRSALYELRIYHAHPGKLDALNARFRDHTLGLFEKHGMTNMTYWIEAPSEASPGGKVIYVLAYPSREAREVSWKSFGSDPEWRQVAARSEAGGKLVAKVDSTFMSLADYSPAVNFGDAPE